MEVFHEFKIRTRYLARYIVHVNFIKLSPIKYHVHVNPKNGVFLKHFWYALNIFNTFRKSGSHCVHSYRIVRGLKKINKLVTGQFSIFLRIVLGLEVN